MAGKAPGAFKTIGELSSELGVAQHILRYWETRFPQLKPLQRAGNRRYYRPDDVELARRIHRLLNQEGYTVRGVQKVLRDKSVESPAVDELQIEATTSPARELLGGRSSIDVDRLKSLRDRLAEALEA